MSELHCPARIVVCADPTAPLAVEVLSRERVARLFVPPVSAERGAGGPARGQGTDVVGAGMAESRLAAGAGAIGPGVAEPRLAAGAEAVRELIDELADQHRGECIVLVVDAATLPSLADLGGLSEDREITVLSD